LAFPWDIREEHTVRVPDAEQNGSEGRGDGDSTEPAHGEHAPANPRQTPWRSWTISVSALLALLVSLLLMLGDLLASILSNLGGPQPVATFIDIAVAGHAALALSSACLFGVGIANTARRRPAVLAEWAIIPIGIGWFVLWGRLAAG